MSLVQETADSAINIIASGASIVAAWPVSNDEKRSTSLSNRERISSVVDLSEIGVFMLIEADNKIWVGLTFV